MEGFVADGVNKRLLCGVAELGHRETASSKVAIIILQVLHGRGQGCNRSAG